MQVRITNICKTWLETSSFVYSKRSTMGRETQYIELASAFFCDNVH